MKVDDFAPVSSHSSRKKTNRANFVVPQKGSQKKQGSTSNSRVGSRPSTAKKSAASSKPATPAKKPVKTYRKTIQANKAKQQRPQSPLQKQKEASKEQFSNKISCSK